MVMQLEDSKDNAVFSLGSYNLDSSTWPKEWTAYSGTAKTQFIFPMTWDGSIKMDPELPAIFRDGETGNTYFLECDKLMESRDRFQLKQFDFEVFRYAQRPLVRKSISVYLPPRPTPFSNKVPLIVKRIFFSELCFMDALKLDEQPSDFWQNLGLFISTSTRKLFEIIDCICQRRFSFRQSTQLPFLNKAFPGVIFVTPDLYLDLRTVRPLVWAKTRIKGRSIELSSAVTNDEVEAVKQGRTEKLSLRIERELKEAWRKKHQSTQEEFDAALYAAYVDSI